MIEMSQAAKAEANPANTEEELEERISLRIGSIVRAVDVRNKLRRTGVLDFVELNGRNSNQISLKFHGIEARTIHYPLDLSFEYLLDGRWQPIHIPPKREIRR